MKGYLALLALAGAAFAGPVPQGVTGSISAGDPPAGCSSDYTGSFEITVVNVTHAKRGLETRQKAGVLTLTLSGGILKDQDGRTGYIAANDQFQFDNPPQTGAIYTAGWSVCSNGSLALGHSAIFYQCLSGTFYNLYDKSQGGQCAAIYIEVMSGSSAPAATQASDGQPGATTATTKVTQLSDGQPQATSVIVTQISDGQPQAVTQLSDGQPQGPTGAPVSQISDGQPQATTKPGVTQISDGQPQAPTKVPVTQISDGQPQATTKPGVTQISDGQPQAPTGVPVTQISDGQPQATTHATTGAPVTQISDGQPQATTHATTGAAVTQISDGQPQATTGVHPATFTGAAAPREVGGSFALVAGIVGAVAML